MEKMKKKLGFGFMRLPMKGEEIDIAQTCGMVDEFLARGFNYFDVARGYLNSRAETTLRTCLTSRHPRESYLLTDKLSGSFSKPRRMCARCSILSWRTAAWTILTFT